MEPYHFGLPTDQYQKQDGKWFWHTYECEGADVETFTPCNDAWAFDVRGVFRQQKRLRSKNPDDCRVLNLLFAKDREHVYYIEGIAHDVVNVAAFRVLDSGRYVTEDGTDRRFGFAMDDHFVYSHDYFSGKPKVLKGADIATFQRLSFGYAKDRKHVWQDSFRIKKAIPASFSPISSLHSRDEKHVYYCESPLDGADPARFHVLRECYGADDQHVYFQRGRLKDVDRATFEFIDVDGWVARDQDRAYYAEHLVTGADPNTFEKVGSSLYFRDKDSVYYLHERVEGADPVTFQMVGNSHSRARDKYRNYVDGKPQ